MPRKNKSTDKNTLIEQLKEGISLEHNPNCGIIEGQLYFGFQLCINRQYHNILVFDNGEIDTDFKDIKFRSDLIFEPNQISPKAINEWFSKQEAKEIATCFNEFKSLAEEFLDVDEITLKILFLWTLHCYLINLFGVTLYVHLKGLPGSGKSTIMKFCCLLTPKAEYVIDPSTSALFRGLDTSQNTLYIDEFENYDEKEKKTVTAILNAGYTKTGNVSRVDKDKTGNFVKKSFNVFSPKMFASVADIISQTLNSRILEIYVIRTDKTLKDIESINEQYSRIFVNLRDDLYKFSLKNWKTIEKNFEEVNNIQIKGRDLQIFKPILAFAKLLSWENEILEYYLNEIEEKKEDSIETDRNFVLIKALYYLVRGTKIKRASLQDIRDYYLDLLGVTQDEYKPTSKSIGRQMKRFGLSRYKIRYGEGTFYDLHISEIVKIIKRYGYEKFIDLKNVESELSAVNEDLGRVKEEKVG